MKMRFCVLALLVAGPTFVLRAQNPNAAVPNPYSDSMANISAELTKISKSVQLLNDRFKVFFDKLGAGGTNTVNEKQQKIITGIQMLAAAEQRVASLQSSQIDLVEKFNETRSKLIQVESDLRPRNIDRSVALEGTTETEELRESRRLRLQGERTSLTQLASQLQNAMAENSDTLREAQSLANRMRRIYLPQIEREMSEQ